MADAFAVLKFEGITSISDGILNLAALLVLKFKLYCLFYFSGAGKTHAY
ncbi:hypothetical protein l13_03290 [Neisseria weaveri ATCC 51223]|nr:hypothetical protein l13_03290 [Neisseria weaveri ATCC 51223]